MTKPSIYAVYSFLGKLEETGGDQINEIATLRSLSMDFDVYYNNQRFDPDSADFGLSKSEVEIPDRAYDLVYVRSNKPIFWAAKERGLRTAYFGEYDPEIYRAADAIVTFNKTTKSFIEARKRGESVYPGFDAMFPAGLECPDDILVFEQSGRADFMDCSGSVTARKFRMRWGGDFVLGFFGRIDEVCMPRTALMAWPAIQHGIPGARFVMAGRTRRDYKRRPEILYEDAYFTAAQMPHVVSSCDAVVGIEQPEAEWAGSNRVLDSVRCGVPFLSPPYSARREQLGDDYPLFFTDAKSFHERVMLLRYDQEFRRLVTDSLDSARSRLAPLETRRRNSERVKNFLSKHLVAA